MRRGRETHRSEDSMIASGSSHLQFLLPGKLCDMLKRCDLWNRSVSAVPGLSRGNYSGTNFFPLGPTMGCTGLFDGVRKQMGWTQKSRVRHTVIISSPVLLLARAESQTSCTRPIPHPPIFNDSNAIRTCTFCAPALVSARYIWFPAAAAACAPFSRKPRALIELRSSPTPYPQCLLLSEDARWRL